MQKATSSLNNLLADSFCRKTRVSPSTIVFVLSVGYWYVPYTNTGEKGAEVNQRPFER